MNEGKDGSTPLENEALHLLRDKYWKDAAKNNGDILNAVEEAGKNWPMRYKRPWSLKMSFNTIEELEESISQLNFLEKAALKFNGDYDGYEYEWLDTDDNNC